MKKASNNDTSAQSTRTSVAQSTHTKWELADMLSYVAIYPKRNDKIKVLKDYTTAQPWIKEVLYYAYSPFIQYFIAEKSMPKAVREPGDPGTFHPLNDRTWRELVKPILDALSNRTMPHSEIQTKVGGLLAKFSVADQNVLKRVILKDLRFGMAEKTINEALGENLIHVPDTQLCEVYDPEKDYKLESWWASRKMNGHRCRFKKFGDKWMLLTRKDHPVQGFSHLEGELLELCSKNGLSLVDGELFSTNIPFQEIASIVRGNSKITKEQKASVYFNVFCALKEGGNWVDTGEMADWLFNMFNTEMWSAHYPHILPVEYREIPNTPESIDYWCREYVKEGYEGIVLRHPENVWVADRTSNLLKLKPFFECDLPIEEVKYGTPGKKWENKVAALLCRGEVPAVQREVFGVNVFKPVSMEEAEVMVPVKVEASCSTLTDDERETVTELAADLPGMTIEIKFQTFTDKPDDDGYYSLSFPTFSKFKGLE